MNHIPERNVKRSSRYFSRMQEEFPQVYIGELRFERFCDSYATSLRDFARQCNPESVSSLCFSGCNLGALRDDAFELVVKSIRCFAHLQILKMNGCNLCTTRLKAIMRCLKDHHYFANDNAQSSKLYFGLNNVFDASFLDARWAPLRGVGTFSITATGISDVDLEIIASTFPRLINVYLCKTNVECKYICALVRSLPRLQILGLDSTPCGDVGVRQILNAMKERCQVHEDSGLLDERAAPLEVWLRDVQSPTMEWDDLLKFVCSRENLDKFVLKHDMQNAICTFPRHAIASHSNVVVAVYISGHEPFVVNYGKVLCSKSVQFIAKDAINELNLFLMCDEKKVKDPDIMARKTAFRIAFARLFLDAEVNRHHYVPGCIQFIKTDVHSGNVEANYYTGNELLGKRNARCEYLIEVEAEVNYAAKEQR